jgi:hypothetical protein
MLGEGTKFPGPNLVWKSTRFTKLELSGSPCLYSRVTVPFTVLTRVIELCAVIHLLQSLLTAPSTPGTLGLFVLCSLGWPQTSNPPASASQVLGLQV